MTNKTDSYYFSTSSGTSRNDILHDWMGQIRSSIIYTQVINISGILNGGLHFGMCIKATEQVMFGIMMAPNSPAGFYFRDSSANSTASSTDFTL